MSMSPREMRALAEESGFTSFEIDHPDRSLHGVMIMRK
jgi:hypothetical protein